MKNSEKRRFGKMLLSLGELWEKKIEASTIALYFDILKKYDIEDVENAGHAIMQNETYFPRPEAFRRYIEQDAETSAISAWTRILDTISAGGPYTTTSMEDQAAGAAIRAIGGWDRLLKMNNFEQQAIQRNFERVYVGIRKSGRYPALPAAQNATKSLAAGSTGDELPEGIPTPAKPKITELRDRMAGLVDRLELTEREKAIADRRTAEATGEKPEPMTQDEFEKRKAEQLAALKEYQKRGAK